MRTPLLAGLVLVLSGCLGAADLQPAQLAGAPGSARSHVLEGAVEPEGLEAMTFRVVGGFARAGPHGGFGEPSVWAHLDGSLWVAAPGCQRERLDPSGQGRPCRHGMVFRSLDDGASWELLNDPADGSLTDDEDSFGNGDAEVTVDAAGNVYVSNLADGIQVLRSEDLGATWAYAGNATPPEHWSDRQWMAAGKAGHLVVTWMGGEGAQRAVAVNTTFDGGRNWTGTVYVGEDIGWLGQVVLDPPGERAFIPFTQGLALGGPLGAVPLGALLGSAEYQLLVARSLDGGATWDVVDTGARVTRAATGAQWSGVIMAPALDITGDGTLVYAWSEEVNDAAGLGQVGSRVRYVASADGGATWTEPVTVSEAPNAIMPWVTGGAGDRAAITYYASQLPLDSDYVGRWDVVATVVDGVAGQPGMASTVVDTNVHTGGICGRGGACFLTASDRALLDFFEADVMPDGRLVVVYPADPIEGGKYLDLRVAIQEGGTRLLGRPS